MCVCSCVYEHPKRCSGVGLRCSWVCGGNSSGKKSIVMEQQVILKKKYLDLVGNKNIYMQSLRIITRAPDDGRGLVRERVRARARARERECESEREIV